MRLRWSPPQQNLRRPSGRSVPVAIGPLSCRDYSLGSCSHLRGSSFHVSRRIRQPPFRRMAIMTWFLSEIVVRVPSYSQTRRALPRTTPTSPETKISTASLRHSGTTVGAWFGSNPWLPHKLKIGARMKHHRALGVVYSPAQANEWQML